MEIYYYKREADSSPKGGMLGSTIIRSIGKHIQCKGKYYVVTSVRVTMGLFTIFVVPSNSSVGAKVFKIDNIHPCESMNPPKDEQSTSPSRWDLWDIHRGTVGDKEYWFCRKPTHTQPICLVK